MGAAGVAYGMNQSHSQSRSRSVSQLGSQLDCQITTVPFCSSVCSPVCSSVCLSVCESVLHRACGVLGAARVMVIAGLMMAMCSPVWAQAEELKPPKASESPSSPKYLMMGLLLVIFGGVVVAVTLKSKRGHQD